MNASTENENREYPVYTLEWFWKQVAYVIALATVLAMLTGIISHIGEGRVSGGLLSFTAYETFSQASSYCFAIISLTLITLMILEVAFRKRINMLQYGLIAAALCLFFFMLLALAEKMAFIPAYVIVSIMIIGLIVAFVDAITRKLKATGICAAMLIAEYAFVLILISIDSMALLVGSLMLFFLIAAAMYFTIKLQIKDNELTLK